MSLRDHLEAIREKHGKLTPKIVVDEARPAKSPIHDRFEWDDAIAAEEWRREQARDLIQSVKVVFASNDQQSGIRYFHSVRTPEGHSYEPISELEHDEFKRRLVLNDMEREWKMLRSRYELFTEFWQLVKQDVKGKSKTA